MCGLVGMVGAGARDEQLLHAMTGAINHRGPDDSGYWTDADAGVAFGHRRLSILDLSPHGHQPMLSADGRWAISYNGEIYNHEELRREIEAVGAAPPNGWRGHSDTEVLVEAIATWGLEAALQKCVGMFAFALWDRRERVLSLIRDRFGEKPMYYGWAGRDFLFGSELKALRHHPQFDRAIDRSALAQYISLTYVPAPLSIYRGIFKLEPGCILAVPLEAAATPLASAPRPGGSGQIRLSRYWDYRDVVEEGLARPFPDEAEALGALEGALAASIRGQAVADVPVGAFLSGGIDSSTIVALYQKYSGVPVRTFSVGFDEAGYDEAAYAKAVARHFRTAHHEHYVTVAEARDVIPLLPQIYDEPFADPSQIPTYLVSRFAREKVTVALTGDGGDELFAGYNRHFLVPESWRKLSRVPLPLRRMGASAIGGLPASLLSTLASVSGSDRPDRGSKLKKALSIAGSAASIDQVYAKLLDEWDAETGPAIGGNQASRQELAFAGRARDEIRIMYEDATGYLPNDILCKVDRASMAVSLETRVPFLDHRVAAVAARIPIGMQVGGGQGKRILRKLLYQEAPAELFERPKSGFAIPVGQWIKGSLRPWAEELLEPGRMAEEGWLDPGIIQRRWREHLSGKRDSTFALWGVLMFQAWLRDERA
jgi:asparagine synthase (glutamine-hydrolysing)